jgi:hypothetical protein
MATLRDLVSGQELDMKEIERYLDSLDHDGRVAEIRTLGRAHQARLFDAAEGHKPISLDDVVGSARPAMEEVVHHGKNSLPAFNRFAKVFVRPPRSDAKELWGYNRAGGFVESVVGPGYFVVYPHGERELLVDYLRIPPERPAHWPEILPNSARLSKFVYHGTQDILRGVSKHVSIGRATKNGKPMSAWFTLCREDPE